MEIRYNYQIRIVTDKRHWDEIEVIQRPDTCRVSAIMYAKRLARVHNAEIRFTEGDDPLNTSATYISDKFE